jgi:RNA polymerase sigma-70 factor (ECF subfamily)
MNLFASPVRIPIDDMILEATMNDPRAFDRVHDAIARTQRGDVDALEIVIGQYQHRLYRYLVRLTKNPSTAEDLFQQTWVRVIEKIKRFDGRRHFDSWLFSVAHNLAVDHFRSERTTSLDAPDESGIAPSERMIAGDPGILDQVLNLENAAILEECMEVLPAIYREVLTLRFEEGMKLDEIAAVAGVPLSTVKSRLSRALEGLRAMVEARMAGGKRL